jgi:hypothetical protein
MEEKRKAVDEAQAQFNRGIPGGQAGPISDGEDQAA